MFCTICGTSLQTNARFCSNCGTAVASKSATTAEQGSASGPSARAPEAYDPQKWSGTALLSSTGESLPALQHLAGAISTALDQAVEPRLTHGLEVAKMKAYRTMGGLTIPQYYGEYILPTYATVVGIDLVPHQSPQAPVLTWAGFHQFLIQKIASDPEATFSHLTRLLPALKIRLNISRRDFPASPFPHAQAKEAKFRMALSELAGKAQQGGSEAADMQKLQEVAGQLRMSKMRLAMAQSMANTMDQAGLSMLNSSTTNGYWVRR